LLIATVNGVRVGASAMAQPLLEAGFAVGAMGFYVRRIGAKQTANAGSEFPTALP
jgi:hypothetical protein